jgi:hypothetical protein
MHKLGLAALKRKGKKGHRAYSNYNSKSIHYFFQLDKIPFRENSQRKDMFNYAVLAIGSILSPQPRSTPSPTPPSLLNVTALTSTQDGYSTIQCWQLTSSAPVAAMSALNYGIGNTSRATWSIIEPRTVVGEAWAPTVQ